MVAWSERAAACQLYVWAAACLLAVPWPPRATCRAQQHDAAGYVRVQTLNGPVQGRVHVMSSGTVQEYLGIPYAKPPLKHLRFRYPQPVDSWTSLYNATKLPNSCWQDHDISFQNFTGSTMWNPNTKTSEDCLYINVWTPHPRPKNAAVIVWIYGGGFYSGSSTLKIYDGKVLAGHGHIVFISFQYRVGSLGFLAFDREDAPGNMGMFDQQLALKWVKENVDAFGGDPERITLMGESAGAVSVGLHLLSEGSRKYFKRAIMQSGSAIVPWSTMTHQTAKLRGLRLAQAVRCPHDPNDMDAVMDCLRAAPPQNIVQNEWVEIISIAQFPFVPIVDGKFLTEPPLLSMQRRNFLRTEILLGSNLNEGTYFLIYYLTDLFDLRDNVHITRSDFRKSMKELFPQSNSFGQEAIIFQYTDWAQPDSSQKLVDGLDFSVGDHSIVCHVNEFAAHYAAAGEDVYMYYFVHRSSQTPWPKWMGVMHADEINYVFGEPLNPKLKLDYKRREKHLSRQMIRYWANFAETGDPNVGDNGKWTSVQWLRHTSRSREYLTLSANQSEMVTGFGPRTNYCAFWKYYLPQLVHSTDDISEAERQWKLQFHEWSSRYIVDWKYQFEKYVSNQQKVCGR